MTKLTYADGTLTNIFAATKGRGKKKKKKKKSEDPCTCVSSLSVCRHSSARITKQGT